VSSDRYEAERDALVFQISYASGLNFSERWLESLNNVLEELPNFPGPLSHARDEDASTLYDCEVRRILYRGPAGRSKQPVRVLFTLIPPAEDNPHGGTVISLLRLLRGSQSLSAEEGNADATGG
jgi:hypothetical protein